MINQHYETSRNALIPIAEGRANRAVGPKPIGPDAQEWGDKWNQAFHSQMEHLVKESGLMAKIEEQY